jgi:hypothetical protein
VRDALDARAGILECDEFGYPARSKADVLGSDDSLWFGSADSLWFGSADSRAFSPDISSALGISQ